MIQRATGKFWNLNGYYYGRIALRQCNAVQNTHDRKAWNSKSGNDRQALKSPATGKCIHSKIHRPVQVRHIRAQKRKSLNRQPSTTLSAHYAQVVKIINAVDSLVIKAKAFTPQKLPGDVGNQSAGVQAELSDAYRQLHISSRMLMCIMIGWQCEASQPTGRQDIAIDSLPNIWLPQLPASGLPSVLSAQSHLQSLLIQHGFGDEFYKVGFLLYK